MVIFSFLDLNRIEDKQVKALKWPCGRQDLRKKRTSSCNQ